MRDSNPDKSLNLDYNESTFRAFLKNPFQNLIIDLSQANLIEAIEALIQVRNNLSPSYGKHYSCLKHHLKCIQMEFKCELFPYHITDVFWSNFIPYLLSKGLSLATIKTTHNGDIKSIMPPFLLLFLPIQTFARSTFCANVLVLFVFFTMELTRTLPTFTHRRTFFTFCFLIDFRLSL